MNQNTEVSTPLLVDPQQRRNVADLLVHRLQTSPQHVAFVLPASAANPAAKARTPNNPTPTAPTKTNLPARSITTAEFASDVCAVAKGLIAEGVAAGDTVAIQGQTSYQWAVADMASLWVGAIVVPIFDTSSAEQVAFIIADAKIKWAFADSPSKRQVIRSTMEDSGTCQAVWALDWDETGFGGLIKSGQQVSDAALEERRLATSLEDTATLVYTSGTEGRPKGVIITHENLVGQVLNIGADYREVVNDRGSTLIFLPLAHVLARGLQLICLSGGMTISYEADPSKAVTSLSQVKPSFLVVVPRVLQKIRDRIAENAQQKHLSWLWRSAEKTAIAQGLSLQSGATTDVGALHRAKHALFDRLFYSKVRALLGGNLDYILSGAAPLEEDLGLLFHGMGIEVIEGYGLTETTAPLTGNRSGDNRCGTVGRPEPGHTVRISSSGEILAQGVGVSPGYWNPADNEGAFVDGFLRTGDLGSIDEDGRLTITGRVKEMIVTAGGKSISPQLWQNTVEKDPLIAHAVVVGDLKPYPAAFILLDRDEVGPLEDPHEVPAGKADIVTDPGLIEQVASTLRQANARVSRPERIKRFRVLSVDLEPGGPNVTPTMKLRRSQLLENLGSAMDDLYRSGQEIS